MSNATPSRGRTEYVRLLAQAYLRGATGTIECRSGPNHRTFHFRSGRPIGLQSERAKDSVEAVLVKGGFVSDMNLGRILKSSTGGESIDELLVRHARADADALHRRLERWMMGAISTPLGWPRSDCRLIPVVKHLPLIERLAIGVHVPVLRALWRGVGRHLTDGEARADLAALPAQLLWSTSTLPLALRELDLDPAYQGLQEVLDQGRMLADVLTDITDRAGTLVRLMWFLEVAGTVRRGPPGPDPEPVTPPTAEAEPVDEAPLDPEVVKLVAAVEDGHDLRMQGDYYRFLMISRNSPAERIVMTCRRLQRRWGATAERADLPEPARALVQELLGTLPLVYRTLSDPTRRAEYDRRLQAGRAPTAGGLQAADRSVLDATKRVDGTSGGATPGDLAAAQERLDAGDFAKAAGILDYLRRENPSDPDVLAALGWARFQLGGDSGADAAEDYLRLALTFEPTHLKALEYASKLAIQQGENDVAESRLRRLLAKDPNARWARRALRAIQQE
jgi:hypothetical protein